MIRTLTHLIWFLALLTPKAQATDLKEFNLFGNLPIDIQVKVFSHLEKPGNTYLLSKRLRAKMQETFVWAKPEVELQRFVDEAIDDDKNINPDADIFQELSKPSGMILIRRLIWHAAGLSDEAAKLRVRNVMTRQIADNLFFYKDALIEFSWHTPKFAESALHLARGDTAYGVPLVHSSLLPKFFLDNIQKAEVVTALINDDGIYRIWRLSSRPDLNCLTTLGLPGCEEYVVANPIELDGRIPASGIQVHYHDGTLRDWPIEE